MSIVDYLKSQGQDSSFQSRGKLAGEFGIQNYSGTSEQNNTLLKQMQEKAKAPVVETPAPNIPAPVVETPAPATTPVVQPKVEQKVETPTIQVPTPEKKEEKAYTPVVSHQDWIERGRKPTELVDLVETKYGITAEYDPATNTVKGYDEAGNNTKTWSFDQNGDSVRKDTPVYSGDQFLSDFNNVLASGDKNTINRFLTKNKSLYKDNKEALVLAVKDFQKQKKVNETVNRISSLDGKGLYNASINGDFSQGDDVFNALSPEKQAEFLAYQQRYVRQDAKDPEKKVVADLNSDDAEEVYNKMAIHNPEYQKKYNEIVFENKERRELQDDLITKYETIERERLTLQKLKDKIDAEHPSASETYKRALLNRESGALLDNIEEMTVDYNVGLAQYNMIDADVQAEYEAYSLDAGLEYNTYQQAIQTSVARYNTDRANMNQQEILKMQYEQADLTLKKNQEFTMQLRNFDNQVADGKGVYQTNDKGELLYVTKGVAQKVLESNGSVVATERYENYQETLEENDYGGYDIIRTYNDGTRPDISSYDMNGNLVGGTSSVVAGALNKVGADKKLQCGQAVNTYLQNLGGDRIFGDSYESKTDQINSDVPMMGGVAIWNPNQGQGKYSEYGHVGVITGISADGKTLEITDWNYNGDEEKMVHNVERSVIEFNGGYHIPTTAQDSSSDTLGDSQLSTDAKTWVESWNNGAMDLETILTKIGSSKESLPLKTEIQKYVNEQGGVAYRTTDDPIVKNVQNLEDTISGILGSNYLHTVSGTVQSSPLNFITGGKSDLLADLKFLIEGQTLQELIDAKANGATFGALSNEELKMLQASSSKIAANAIRDKDTNEIIGFKMSEDKLLEELEQMKLRFAGKVDRMTGVGMTKEDKDSIEVMQNLIIK